MLYFILENNHKIDLTHKRVTFIEKNPWFETEFNSEYSFPFEMHADEFVKITDFAHYNSVDAKTQFKGKLYKDGQLTDATLKIQQQKGKVISGIIFSGLEAFPTFNKSLKELSLDNFPVSNLKQHALQTITKNYPEVSHNFGMIHTDKYDPSSEDFNSFGKIINNFQEGNFIVNSVQPNTNIDLVRNIMQPFPYLMHVVERGIADAGCTLSGDILEIDDFKKALIIRDGEYFDMTAREAISFKFKNSEWDVMVQIVNGLQHVHFYKTFVIERKGDYLIFGDVFSVLYTGFLNRRRSDLYFQIGYIRNGATTDLFTIQLDRENGTDVSGPTMHHMVVDLPYSFELGDVIFINKTEARRDITPNPTPDYPEASSIELIPVRYRDVDGSPIVSLRDLNEVNLSKVVPDMSFGDLIIALQKWKNLDFTVTGSVVSMNFIRPKLDRTLAFDLSEFDIEEPLRTFSDERSYELFFTDGKSHETYKYDSVFVTRDSSIINEYRTNKNTTQMPIDLLPYPVLSRDSVTTAFNFDNETSKLRLAFFKSVVGSSIPVCYENTNALIPQIYDNEHKEWLHFLVNSISYQWDFVISVEKFKDILINSLVYCYGNYHVFSETEKERLNQLYWRVGAKTESLV